MVFSTRFTDVPDTKWVNLSSHSNSKLSLMSNISRSTVLQNWAVASGSLCPFSTEIVGPVVLKMKSVSDSSLLACRSCSVDSVRDDKAEKYSSTGILKSMSSVSLMTKRSPLSAILVLKCMTWSNSPGCILYGEVSSP